MNHTGRTVLCLAAFQPYPTAPEFVAGDTYTIAEDLGPTVGCRLWNGGQKVMVSARDEENLEMVGTWRGWVLSQKTSTHNEGNLTAFLS